MLQGIVGTMLSSLHWKCWKHAAQHQSNRSVATSHAPKILVPSGRGTIKIIMLINKTLMSEGPSHIIIRVATIGMYRYWMSMEELLKEVGMQGGEEWWPWTTSHIHSGDMERSFLNHLLSADTQVQAINTYNNIHVLHVSIVIYMYNWSYRLSLSPFPPSVFFLPVCLWTDTK